MGTKKPTPLFYILIKDAKTRPRYKTKSLTVYANGVPNGLLKFTKWLEQTIQEKAEKNGGV